LRRGLAALALALAVALGPACSSTETTDRGATLPTPTDAQSWTGFGTTTGLEVVATDETAGIDRLVRLALRGPEDDVDRALAAAGFTADFAPGVKVFEPPLAGVDLTGLTDPASAEDRWRGPSGPTLTRKVVRGGQDGAVLIHVWAFTT
jgi:hypothetical protein